MESDETPTRHARGGAAIYEIDGRVLIRTHDSAGDRRISRDVSASILDGYPDTSAAQVGHAVFSAVGDAQQVAPPLVWPRASGYNATLLAETVGDYKSFRAWQRAARCVNVAARADAW
ncbi:MAG: hypothetical protein ACT4OX_07415 [Actinomycetota bacterium]